MNKQTTTIRCMLLVTLQFLSALMIAGCGGSSGNTSVGDISGFHLSDTGQVDCYDEDGNMISAPVEGADFFGQDGQFAGATPSFTDNGDGTVTDNVTGLTWQKTPQSAGSDWATAKAYCESLELGGYSDWRLPSTKEMFSLSDFSQGWPYLNTEYFDIAGTSVTKDEQYWADYYVGMTVEGGNQAAFGINHGTGHIKAYAATSTPVTSDTTEPSDMPPPPDDIGDASSVSGRPSDNYVRAVRGNDTYGINVFVENSDGTVTDTATGLMWQAADDGVTRDWKAALAYAEDSELAGYTDWRLPNVRELQSIVDYTRSPSAYEEWNQGPAIDSNFFTLTPLPEGTTNTANDYGYYWSSTSAYFGGQSLEYYYAWYVAFGTAVNDEGNDFHGAGGVRFDTKHEGGPAGEDAERYYNYVLLVRDVDSD